MPEINYTFDKKRFEAFIDAIIAVIITILVLELKIPETDNTNGLNTRQQLAELIPSFVSYIGSFLLIAGIWIDHHILFLNLKGITKRYIFLNMMFMLSLSLIPFTTGFAGHHYNDSFAVALLFVNYVLMNVFFAVLYWYADWKGLLPAEFYSANRVTARYSMFGIVALLVAIPLAYYNTYLSFALGIIIFSGHLLKKR